MLKTYTIVLTEQSRNLLRNMWASPVLYLWFLLMLVFSVMMGAFLVLFMVRNEITFKVGNVVMSLFSLFLVKTVSDIHKYFTTSEALVYPLSTQVSHRRTIFEVFLVVFWVNLGLFVLLSSLFSLFLVLARIPLSYPVEYLQILLGILLSIILGTCFALHFFSPYRLRLIPAGCLVAGLWYSQELWMLLVLLVCAVVYLWWSLGTVLSSYQFVARKKRHKEQFHAKVENIRTAIFHKETTILWRERLLPSFVVASSFMGGFVGYLAVFGEDLFIPPNLQEMAGTFLPGAYLVLGIYVVIIYTSVFPSIALFLNEEHTVWILRHLPISWDMIVQGKAYTMLLPFIASFPFLAYYSAFMGISHLIFSVWFLVFSFLGGMIIAIPLGVKYIGKKSDILVLYCVALAVFVFVSIGAGFEMVFARRWLSRILFYIVSILLELIALRVSLSISSSILSKNTGENNLRNHRFLLVRPKL